MSESSEWGWTCHFARGEEAFGWLIFLIPVNEGGRPVIPSVDVGVGVEVEVELKNTPELAVDTPPFMDPGLKMGPVELNISPAAELGNPAGSTAGGEDTGELDDVVLAPDPATMGASLSSPWVLLLVLSARLVPVRPWVMGESVR